MQTASRQDIFFSHRTYFFFQSMIFADDDGGDGAAKRGLGEKILKELKAICIESENLLCLTNTDDIFQNIVRFGMLQFYPDLMSRNPDLKVVLDPYDHPPANATDEEREFFRINQFMTKVATDRVIAATKRIKEYQEEQVAKFKAACAKNVEKNVTDGDGGQPLIAIESFDYKSRVQDIKAINTTPDGSLQARKLPMEVDTSRELATDGTAKASAERRGSNPYVQAE